MARDPGIGTNRPKRNGHGLGIFANEKTPQADPVVGFDPGLGVSVTKSGKSIDVHGKKSPTITPTDIAKAADKIGTVAVGMPFSQTNVGKLLIHGDTSGFKDTIAPPKGGAGQVSAGVGPFPIKAGGAVDRAIGRLTKKVEPPAPPVPAPTALGPRAEVSTKLGQAKKLRREQEKLYSQERAKRIAEYKLTLEKGLESGLGPEEAHAIAKQRLAGELPKLEFTAGKELSRENLPDLFRAIREHPDLRDWERVRGADALQNVFKGKVPQRSEIRLLETVFGKSDTDALVSSVDLWKKLGNTALQVLNVPRALKSSYDVSAPFRQGLVLGARHPAMFAREIRPMIQALKSEGAYNDIMDEIASRPTFKAMQDSKLALTDLENIASREEAFASNLAEVVPGVRASGRAYVAFLNKFRADAFDNYLKLAEAQGRDITDQHLLDSISKWINYATGRGGQSKFVASHAVGLNALLFSPRLIASRVNLLFNPVYYAQLDPFARKQALQGMAQLIGGISLTLWLAKMAGAKVGLDPRSADFGKIKVGNTRVDVMGGFQQYIVAATRLLKGESVSSTTGEVEHLTGGFGKSSRGTLVSRLAQQKLAPVPAFGWGFLNNENFAGQPFDPVKETGLLFAPLGPQNAVETYRQEGPGPALAGLGLGSIGFGVQTYGSKKKKPPAGRGAPGGLGVFSSSSARDSGGGLGIFGP